MPVTLPQMHDPTPTGRVVIAGGSGVLGRSLARSLHALGAEPVLLARTEPRDKGPWRCVTWDGRTLGAWADCLDGATALVNLAGRSVDCVKTPDNRDEILRSRVDSTLALGRAVREASSPPPVWVQMSTAHAYGDPPDTVCDEDSPFGLGLAPLVATRWEEAFDRAAPEGVRRVILRTGFVLTREGGAMARLGTLARWGLGGTVGHGRQGMSWIHEADMNRVFTRAIADDTMRDAYIASAPEPVSNKVFMRELRRALRRPFGLPAPAFVVRLGAPLVLRTDPELALYGRYCVPKRLLAEGFEFRYPGLAEALADLCRR